jgi:2-(3-amino-3-carboxypropyl)histidine synthase
MAKDFDFEISRIVSTMVQRDCGKVILQFPEGLKRRAADVAAEISRIAPGRRIIVHGEPCFGACDVPDTDADLIVNFGHLPIPCVETPRPVLFIQARSSADPLPIVEKALDLLPERVGLATTAQHLHMLPAVVDLLERNKRLVRVGKGDGRVFAAGQVLGCNISAVRSVAGDVDVVLFIGTGNFHALAISLGTGKKVLIADPVVKELRDVESLGNEIMKQRHGAIETAKGAERFGVILSTKAGQRRETVALGVEKALTDRGKRAVVVEMGFITPQKLDAFGLDCWVSTACPRMAIDDYAMFAKPVITPVELEIALGIRAWDDYAFDEIFAF